MGDIDWYQYRTLINGFNTWRGIRITQLFVLILSQICDKVTCFAPSDCLPYMEALTCSTNHLKESPWKGEKSLGLLPKGRPRSVTWSSQTHHTSLIKWKLLEKLCDASAYWITQFQTLQTLSPLKSSFPRIKFPATMVSSQHQKGVMQWSVTVSYIPELW